MLSKANIEELSDLPKVPVKIGSTTYNLCVDLAALANAEAHFTRQGHELNLVAAIPLLWESVPKCLEVFVCAVHTFHPTLSFERALQLVTLKSCPSIISALVRAWPAMSEEAGAANANLCFDLTALAETAEHFSGLGCEVNLPAALSALSMSAIRTIYPLAVHRFRPDLSFVQAQQLMSLPSIYAVAFGLSAALKAASLETRETFFLRICGRARWTGVAHA